MANIYGSQDHGAKHDDHGDHHDHPAHLAHHWASMPQQFDAGKLGMWLFLATEVLLFGGLFCAYAVWRGNHPELFKYGSTYLDTMMGATNTVVLILSSLTMAWGVTAAQKNQQGLLKLMLILTLIGAATFMVIKYFEYTHKFHEGWFPGIRFYDPPSAHSQLFWNAETVGAGAVAPAPMTAAAPAPETFADLPLGDRPTYAHAPTGPQGLATEPALTAEPFSFDEGGDGTITHPLRDTERPANAHMFFNIYFMMTGLHGIHVLVGMIVIGWLLIRSFRGDFNSEYFTPVDLGGLYWHIVDLIWIFLFPLFYLI